MLLSNVMTKPPVTIGMDTRLGEIKRIFEARKFHHLLVVDDDILVGVISDRDLLKSISHNVGKREETAQDLATLNKTAKQIMTRKLITLTPGATIFDAVSTFNRHPISCIPVVDNDKKPVGSISWRDIMRALESIRDKNKKATPGGSAKPA